MAKNVLMVVTNHTTITDDHKTGLWLEEFAVPYNVFKKNGFDVKVTSIEGGDVPLDPNSIEDHAEWKEAENELKHTSKVSSDDTNFDAIFLPGGHGTMFDFPENEVLQTLLTHYADQDKVVGSVCHGPAGLVNTKYSDGRSFVSGKKLTSFTDEEEKEMQLDAHMPFMLESKLRENGALFERGDKWSDHSVRDGRLITGQNPQSSQSTAEKVVEALQ
ncbi:type 1 glutamine amidotransferase domain-containing protein [Alteribacillus sp. HJP-4]|uniref:type 1 glutamine amidotransferase domain-containing protein n=1 Tax=Alteribacillus sp. HJP-4 TaxID=2775394 RepID=UPI0035CCCCDF